MAISSLFSDLTTRELNGRRVRKRPVLENLYSDSGCPGAGIVKVEHYGSTTPPLAISFAKTVLRSHLLAVSDEDGYVGLYNTRCQLQPSASFHKKKGEDRVSEWVAHDNAIFDLCWIKDDNQVLTASGDQTVKIWDVDRTKCIGILTGHTGSVKSLSTISCNPDLVVSGSRDGSFALWDLRCETHSTNSRGEARFFSTALVKDAHPSSKRKGLRRRKASSMSITAVLYLKDQVSIASAGATDSVVKFWDTRNLKTSITQACPKTLSTRKDASHGISSLSQDSSGVFLSASCMDDRIYLYNALHINKGPIKVFSGSKIESFYVKAAISPDGSHVLCGSGDGNAYVWQFKKPESPVALAGHEGEVTAVDWCSSEFGKIATSSDDFTVRVWNMKKGSPIDVVSPASSFRKRIMANPVSAVKKLVMDEPATSSEEDCHNHSKQTEACMNSPEPSKALEFRTPDSSKKRKPEPVSDQQETEKSPYLSTSPSSVLNPPSSSKKRTIRDYYIAS